MSHFVLMSSLIQARFGGQEMIFPSLRSPPRQERQDTNRTRPHLWFLRMVKARSADRTAEPSRSQSRGDPRGSEVEPLAGPVVQ